MNKRKELSHDDLIDSEFATSTYLGKKPLSEKELRDILEKDLSIYQKFKTHGYITSKKYPFITRATFDDKKASDLEVVDKTPEQKDQAKKMRKIVEKHFNEIRPKRTIKVEFATFGDSECALYDDNSFDCQEIRTKLEEEFK
jgi:hypothetical protein